MDLCQALVGGAGVGAIRLSLHSVPRFGFNSVSDRRNCASGRGPTLTCSEPSAGILNRHRYGLFAVATLSQNDSRPLDSWLTLQCDGASRAGLDIFFCATLMCQFLANRNHTDLVWLLPSDVFHLR
jgi:hypothetical protein